MKRLVPQKLTTEEIKRRVAAAAAKFENVEPLYGCYWCQDIHYQLDEKRPEIIDGWPCPHCESGQAIIRGDAEREAKRKRKRRKLAEIDDDLPI